MTKTQNMDTLPYHIPLPNNQKITLYKNGNNENIYYYFTFEKKMYRGSTGKKDLQSSKEEGFKIYSEVSTGKRKTGSKSSNRFEVVCRKYLQYLEKGKLKKPSERTLNDYKRYSKFLLEKFRGREIDTLCNQSVFEDYKIWRKNYYKTHEKRRQKKYKRNGKEWLGQVYDNVGSVPINKDLRLLISILRYSKTLGLLQDVDIPHCKLEEENHGKKILTDNEFEKLRDYMSVNRPFQWLIISFINSCGVRYPSEILRITWKDIDWDTPCVWIRNRKNPKGNTVDTPFPLIGTSLDVIKTLWSRDNIPKGKDDPVFVNDKGKVVKSIRKCFKTSLEKCGIENDVSLYGFRSRFTTRMCLREDIPVVVLSKLLGHKSTKMVMSHYESLEKDHLLKVLTESRENQDKKKKEKKKKQQQKKQPPTTETDVPDFV